VEAIRLGALDYLQKPVTEEDLERAIERSKAGRTDHTPPIARADGIARWAIAVASVINATNDPKNLVEWSRIGGVAPETLRGWCRTADLPPKRSLDLGRLLRAVSQATLKDCHPKRFLDAAIQR
jgi:hypothetical protein